MPPRNHDAVETYSITGILTAPWAKGAVIASLGLDEPGMYNIIVYTYQNGIVTTSGNKMFGLHADNKSLIDELPGCFEHAVGQRDQGFINGPYMSRGLIVDSTVPITVVANEAEATANAKVYAYIQATKIIGV